MHDAQSAVSQAQQLLLWRQEAMWTPISVSMSDLSAYIIRALQGKGFESSGIWRHVLQDYFHKVPVIFHNYLQQQSHKPYDPSHLSHMTASTNKSPEYRHLHRSDCRHTDLRARFQLLSLGSQTLLAPEARDFVDLILLYSSKYKGCLPTSSRYSNMKDSSLLIHCVHWYTGTQVSEEHVPVFKVVLGSKMQSTWDMRSASIFSVGATLKVDAAKAHTNPHDVISQQPGVLISAAVITSYLKTTVLLLPVIHYPSVRPSVPWSKHRRQFFYCCTVHVVTITSFYSNPCTLFHT